MHHEYEHSRIRSSSAASSSHDRDVIAPGQLSRSALLRAPDVAIVSGLIQRQARDDRGVADGADHAVASASSGSGAPLPTALMRQFETSLGADLSGVRIHTGAASAHAADAVAAKAYTLGNDIHFGAGHYDPASTAGQHLLAHEVAHTVQQAGAPAHPQFKLAVSSPGDPLEHEADRAADAMLSGRPAAVSGASGLSLQRAATKTAANTNSSGLEAFECKERLCEEDRLIAGEVLGRAIGGLEDYLTYVTNGASGSLDAQGPNYLARKGAESLFGTDIEDIKVVVAFTKRAQVNLRVAKLVTDIPAGGTIRKHVAAGVGIPGLNVIFLPGYQQESSRSRRVNTLIHESMHIAGSFGHGGFGHFGPDPYSIASYATVYWD